MEYPPQAMEIMPWIKRIHTLMDVRALNICGICFLLQLFRPGSTILNTLFEGRSLNGLAVSDILHSS
jgi:hypothetical protein